SHGAFESLSTTADAEATASSVADELAALSASELADVVDALEEEMAAASEAMDFETAARIRDQIVAIRTRVEGGSAQDVIARLKAGARKGSAHATRRRYRPHKK
ncbi:MAG TPA: UvrB/UvrC motif-containing protein, partial [Candidatus Olsenella pullicola]|nr:UvrB/UvrC motif-containing protein [Candidatus Olsenella pullicola]